MKFVPILWFLFFLSCNSFAQSDILIRGQVIENGSGEPVPFANVGIPSEHLGTSTDQGGVFSFKVARKHRNDTLQVSALGYHGERYEIADFLKRKSFEIRLDPKTYRMETLKVTDKEPETQWIGKKVRPVLGGGLGMASSASETGAAYAFKVDWNQSLPLKVLYARMFLQRNKNDSLKMRCRIADIDSATGKPGKDLLHENVITSTDKNKGWITCDFTGRDIYVDSNTFYVVFEWLRDPDEPAIAPMFSTGLFFNSRAYARHHVWDRWKEVTSSLIYSLKVEY